MKLKPKTNTEDGPGVVIHACNPSTSEAKAGGSPEVGSGGCSEPVAPLHSSLDHTVRLRLRRNKKEYGKYTQKGTGGVVHFDVHKKY